MESLSNRARRSRRSSSTTITSAVRPTSKPSSTLTRTPSTPARAALAAPDPADPRLAAPAPDDADDERTRGSLAPSRDDRTARVPSHPRPVILTLAGEPIDHVAAVALLREILPLEDRPWNLTVFSVNIASRIESPSTLVLSRFGTRAFASREDAVDALRRLQHAGVLCHVRDEHPFADVPRSVLQTGAGSKSVDGERFRADDGGHFGGLDGGVVRRAGARGGFPSSHRANPQPTRGRDDRSSGVRGGGVGSRVARFLDSLALLRRTRLADVTPLRRRVATLINLYNLGVATSRATIGAPRSSSERSRYFDDVRWVLGGRVYTLNDVEHGLLRGNRPHPYRLFPQFARRDDPRAADGAPAAEVDCRVHFALNCGAKSCPPVDVYTERGFGRRTRSRLLRVQRVVHRGGRSPRSGEGIVAVSMVPARFRRERRRGGDENNGMARGRTKEGVGGVIGER